MKPVTLPRLTGLVPPVLAVLLAWFGAVQYYAHILYVDVFRGIYTAPHLALVANFAAYKAFPYPAMFRGQLPITLQAVMGQMESDVTHEAADLAYRIGQTAGPDNPTLLIARAEYLINAGRVADMGDVLDRLAKQASLQPELSLLQAGYHAMKRETDRLAEVLSKRKCTVLEPQFVQFQIFAEPIPCVS